MRIKSAVLAVMCLTSLALGQTNRELVITPWPENLCGQTTDKVLYQEQGHVKDTALVESRNVQMFWWDSIGRFRFSKTDPDAPEIAYRYLTTNFDAHSPRLPEHLDKVSLPGGFHLGEFEGGKVGLVAGIGYSGDTPFADANGLFGIAHLTWERKLSEGNSLVLSLDYDGGSSFLADVPLPGFELLHREESITYALGFPRNFVQWNITDQLSLTAEYQVPYSFDAYLDYKLAGHFSVFGNVADYFEAFQLNDQPSTDRLFQQMSRVEIGVRYNNPDIWQGMALDAALAVGYAFEQNIYRGWDVRDLDKQAEISDVPYVSLILRGTF